MSDFVPFFIGKRPKNYHDEINERPHTKAAQGYQLQDTGADFSHIKSMGTKETDEKQSSNAGRIRFSEPVVSMTVVDMSMLLFLNLCEMGG